MRSFINRKRTSLVLLAATASFASAVQAQLSVTDGLISRLEPESLQFSGSTITGWNDLSGLNLNAATISAATAPTLSLNVTPSGLNAIDLNGTNQYLQIGPSTAFESLGRSWYVVFKPDSNTNNQSRLINAGYTDANLDGTTGPASYANWGSIVNATTIRTQSRGPANEFVTPTSASGLTSAGQFMITGGIHDSTGLGSTLGIALNADNQRTLIGPQEGATGNPVGHAFTRIGTGSGLSSVNPSSYFDGNVAAVLVYNRVLSAAEQASVESYLRTKYLLEQLAASAIWDGGGNLNFSSGPNWQGDAAPSFTSASLSNLVFAGAGQSVNNDVTDAVLGGIEFRSTAGAYTITGNGFSLAQGTTRLIVNNSTATQTITTGTINTAAGNTISAAAGPIVINSAVNAASGTLNFAGASNTTLNGVVSGSGPIVKGGAGTLTLANSGNSFTGTITANEGVIAVTNAAQLGAAAGTMAAGGGASTGRYQLTGDMTISKPISLAARNGNLLGFAPALVSSGNTTLSGTLSVAGGGSIASVQSDAGKLTIAGAVKNNLGSANAANLYLGGAGEGEITGGISNGTGTGNFGVFKLGTGTWTLSGGANNTYTGQTSVVAGTLKVVGAPIFSSLATPTTTTVESAGVLDLTSFANYELSIGQTLRGKGLVRAGGTVTAYDDTAIDVGNDSTGMVGTLSIQGNLAVLNQFAAPAAGRNLTFDLGETTTVGGGVNDLLDVSGDVTLNSLSGAILINVNPTNGLLAAGNYQLIKYGGTKNGAPAYNVVMPGGNDGYRAVPTIDDSVAGHIDLVVPAGMSLDLVWKGDGGGNAWEVNGATNFNNNTAAFFNADKVTFDDTSTNTTVNITEPVYAGMTVVNSSQDYTFVGNGSLNMLSGTGKLLKQGSGNLTMTNAVAAAFTTEYIGQWEIQGGTISYAYVGLLPVNQGNDRILLNGGTLRYTGTASNNTVRLWSLGPNGGTMDGSGTPGMGWTGTGTLGMPGSGDRTLTLTGNSGSINTIAGILTDPVLGGKTAIRKNGTTSWTLTNTASTFTGGVEVNSGTLIAHKVPGGPVALNGGRLQLTTKATANDPTGTSVVTAITSTGGAATPGGALDVANNSTVVDYSGASPIDDIRQLLRAGFTSGTVGIVSSTLATGNALGYAENSVLNVATFGGVAVDSTAILMKTTRTGDANLDGITNINDFSLLAANFNLASVWSRGDFNYDGQTNISDFSLLAANFNQSVATDLPRGASVPEPAAAALAAIGSMLLGRRRRN